MSKIELVSMPTHSKIFEYWKDKCITNKGEIAIEGEYDYDKSIPVVYDWGEPECWCCRKAINVYDYLTYEEDLENNYKKIWDYKIVRKHLNRCHITPKALGGSYEPENIFLMCEDCHVESPDFIDIKYFLSYVYMIRKRHSSGYYNQLKWNDLVDTANLLGKDVTTLNDISSVYDIKCSLHAGKFSKGTKNSIICSLMSDIEETAHDVVKPNIEQCKQAYMLSESIIHSLC